MTTRVPGASPSATRNESASRAPIFTSRIDTLLVAASTTHTNVLPLRSRSADEGSSISAPASIAAHRLHDGSQPEIQRWIDQRDPDASRARGQVRLGRDLSHLSLDARGGIRFRGHYEAGPRTKVDRDI